MTMGIHKPTTGVLSPFSTILFPDFVFSVLAFSLVVLTVVWTRWLSWTGSANNAKHLPPGPKGVLGLCSLFYDSVTKNLDCQIKTCVKRYGSIVGLFSNLFQGVVIYDYQTLRLAFNNPAILGRPPQTFLPMFDGNSRGIATTSGDTWKEVRKFTVSQLRNLGLGKKTLEPAISQQVEECIAILRTKTNQPFSTKHFFDILAFNVLWQIISSQKLPFGDPQAEKLMKCTERFAKTACQFAMLSRHPKLSAWLLPLLGLENPFPDLNKQFVQFTSQFLNTRLQQLSSSAALTATATATTTMTMESGGQMEFDDFTQAFLNKVHSTTDTNSAFYGPAGYENLQETIRDLFIAGTETSGTTLSWALLFLALNPEKQEKLQREIDTVLGTRPPSLHDRPTMKYTEAVINETLRKSSNLPLGLPHAATEDTTIENFDVPKGTWVIPHLYAIHHCEKTWGDPHSFRPERFLTEDETNLVKHEALAPFGIGKRMCPGVALAYDELFMFITRIFQEFTITWNPLEPKPTMGFKIAGAAAPLPHTLILKERQEPQQC